MALSRQQRIWLAILPKVSSIFSLFGSMWIIIEVASERRKRRAPYHRLLLAMSVYDVLESVWNFASTWPIPKGSPDIIWAYGNQATCTAQGFFLTLSSAVPLYNAMLSLYYVLVINYNYSDAKLRSFVEPAMHLFCFVWAFGTAMYSAMAGLINNANLWCWIAPLPLDCKDSWTHGTAEEGNPNPCIRGDNVWVYRFGFYFIPLWASIFLATFATYVVYRYVYQRDKATLRYRFPDRASIFGALKSLSDDMKLKLTEFSESMGFKTTTRSSKAAAADAAAAAAAALSVFDDDSSSHDDDSDDMDDEIINSQDEKNTNHSNSKEDTVSDEFSSEDHAEDDDDEEMEEIHVGGPLTVVHERSAEMEMSARSSQELLAAETSTSARSQDRSIAFHVMSKENLQDNTPDHLKHALKEDARCPTGGSNAWASVSLRDDASAEAELGGSSSSASSLKQQQQDDSVEDEIALKDAQEMQEKSKRRSKLKRKISEWKQKRRRFAVEMPHTVEVFHQACFYLGAFYCTHIWSTSNRIVQTISGGGSVFPLLALHAFFDPFQGFLNYLVYQRPRYMQLRKRHPDFSRITILLFILRFSFLGGNNARNLRKDDYSKDHHPDLLSQSKRSKLGLSSNFIGGGGGGGGSSKMSLSTNTVTAPEPKLNAGL